MTKQEQINEMLLYVPQTIVAYDANPKGQHLYGEQRLQIAEVLYKAGYRKIRETDDALEEQIKHLNTIVERLDELLGKGINDYIMGIDGVEGLKDMWERSAVRAFADKVKDEFIKSANIQDSITAKKLFRDICPVKVDKVLKKFIKEK